MYYLQHEEPNQDPLCCKHYTKFFNSDSCFLNEMTQRDFLSRMTSHENKNFLSIVHYKSFLIVLVTAFYKKLSTESCLLKRFNF